MGTVTTRRKTPERIFNPQAFFAEVERCRLQREMRWVDVQTATGVGVYTIFKLRQGNGISIDTYLALKGWMDGANK